MADVYYVGSDENTVTMFFAKVILGFSDHFNYFHAIKVEHGW